MEWLWVEGGGGESIGFTTMAQTTSHSSAPTATTRLMAARHVPKIRGRPPTAFCISSRLVLDAMSAAEEPSDLDEEKMLQAFRQFTAECRRHIDASFWFHREEAAAAALNVIELTPLGDLNLAAWDFMAAICRCNTFLEQESLVYAFWARANELLDSVEAWREPGISSLFAFLAITFEALPDLAYRFLQPVPMILSTCIVFYERHGRCTSKDQFAPTAVLNDVLKILHTYVSYVDIVGMRTLVATHNLMDRFCLLKQPQIVDFQMVELAMALIARTFEGHAEACEAARETLKVRARTLMNTFHHLVEHSGNAHAGSEPHNRAIASCLGCFSVLHRQERLDVYHLLPVLSEMGLRLFLERAASLQACYLLRLLEQIAATEDPFVIAGILGRHDLFDAMNMRISVVQVAGEAEVFAVIRLIRALMLKARTATRQRLLISGLYDTLYCLPSSRSMADAMESAMPAE